MAGEAGWVGLALVILAAALGAASFALLLAKDRTYVESPPHVLRGEPDPDAAVVYYSRSGHSEAVAREIARELDCRIARIDSDYTLDLAGFFRAAADTRAKTLPEIRVEPLDLAPVRRLFLASPTWRLRPATPLWTYVEKADLAGREVVLVTTGNTRFEQAGIDAFAGRVSARGGRLAGHLFFRRGRIFWQKSRRELLEEVRVRIAEFRPGR